jgi:hypothetical protein
MRANMMGGLILMMLGVIMVYAVIKLVQGLKEVLLLTIKGIQCILLYGCCILPKLLSKFYKLLKIRYDRRKRARFAPLPVSSQQECPICLDKLVEPVFFSCQRHQACSGCYNEYLVKSVGLNQQLKCPFRD